MADVKGAEELYGHYSSVCEEDGGWLSLRDIVIARKVSRRMLVQPLTIQSGEGEREGSGEGEREGRGEGGEW